MEYSIIQGPRGSGKTTAMLADIHAHIVSGSRQSILVVLADHQRLSFFAEEWMHQYPRMPRPDYVLLGNTLRVRGRRYEHVYVEDVDQYDDLFSDERFLNVLPCVSQTLTLTATPYDLPTFADYVAPPAPPTVKAGLVRRLLSRSRETTS